MSISGGTTSVLQKGGFGHDKTSAGSTGDEFPLGETHGIALWPQHRLLADSRGLGWHDVYTSLAAERSWNGPLHAVPHLCIAYCAHRPALISRRIEGEAAVIKAELRPRLLGVVPENRLSMWDLHGSPDIQLVYLRRSMVERVAQEALDQDGARVELVPRLGFADPLLEQLMLALLTTAREDDGCSDGLYADHLARLMVLHLLRRHSTRPACASGSFTQPRTASLDARMRHVCDLIESTLGENLSLERLAHEAGISAHAFSNAFLRACGVTPHGYVLERRLERAKLLLGQGSLPVVEIALQTGFSSQSHLASAFKRVVGVTPGEYQRGSAPR